MVCTAVPVVDQASGRKAVLAQQGDDWVVTSRVASSAACPRSSCGAHPPRLPDAPETRHDSPISRRTTVPTLDSAARFSSPTLGNTARVEVAVGVHGLRACPSANSRPAAAYAAWAQGSGDEMRLPCTSENDPSTRPLLPRERKTPAPCSSSPRPNRRLPRVAPRLGPATTPPLHPARRRRERRAWLIPPTQPEQPYCRFCDARAAVEIRSTLHFTRPALCIPYGAQV